MKKQRQRKAGGSGVVNSGLPREDRALKDFLSDNEVFADLINAVLFDGKCVVHADELENVDSSHGISVQDGKTVENIVRYRDVVHKAAIGAEFIVFGVENQAKIHYSMPVRNMLYDALNYTDQCRDIAVRQKSYRGWTADEFLSGIPKGTKIVPCFTIVIYYGEDAWDGPRCLHDMLKLNESIRSYIPDYPMNLLEAREGTGRYHFSNPELRSFFDMISDVYGKKSSHTVYPSHIVKLVGIVSGSKELYEMAEKGEEVEEVEMCRALDEIKEEGRQKGLSEGIAQGRTEGLSEGIAQGRTEGLSEGIAQGRTEGLSEGIALGRTEGKLEGMNALNKLYSRLLADGRLEDLQRSTQDRVYQMQLMSEYELAEGLV